MFKPIVLTLFALFGISTTTSAQSIAHEVGIIFGPSVFQSDYGERHDFETNIGNKGFGAGVVHFINFSANNNRDRFFSEHFKVRSELSFNKTEFKHYGMYVDRNPPKLSTLQLLGMKGSTTLVNVGSQLEFSFIKIHDFENSVGSFSPYLSLGFQASYYSTKVGSSLGPLGISDHTYFKYLTPSDGHRYGFSTEHGLVLSVVTGVGVHYKLTKMSDLMLDVRYQGFASDWIDGININKDIYKENKSNDSQVLLNVGYIFYLEF
ncbi:THC0290_0291 family protein [Flavobacterium sp. HTF]|uniref:THC0290_0291 family protein n=1 Tax=Flavobacterium sp. HTF TaxID=2170732 RepID=UPI000D5CA7B0|nr:glutamate dehydrogenase [Flavobacterium sp. HTF]PWB25380.1 glutamate dehydrogenase [Flavobacterium sp. HTF]